MTHMKFISKILTLSILGFNLLACNPPNLCLNDPSLSQCAALAAKETKRVSKSQGGTLKIYLPDTAKKGTIVLNQTSATSYYVVAKLVQQGVASIDLVLSPDPDTGPYYYQASVTAQDLSMLQTEPAEIDVTTPDGVIIKPITID